MTEPNVLLEKIPNDFECSLDGRCKYLQEKKLFFFFPKIIVFRKKMYRKKTFFYQKLFCFLDENVLFVKPESPNRYFLRKYQTISSVGLVYAVNTGRKK